VRSLRRRAAAADGIRRPNSQVIRQHLHRFWIEFVADKDELGLPLSSLLLPGVGVTAVDEEDALELIRRDLVPDDDLPPVSRVVTDIDVSTLDPGHVLPGVGDPSRRGVWFPRYAQR
jgi:hypothetical protein